MPERDPARERDDACDNQNDQRRLHDLSVEVAHRRGDHELRRQGIPQDEDHETNRSHRQERPQDPPQPFPPTRHAGSEREHRRPMQGRTADVIESQQHQVDVIDLLTMYPDARRADRAALREIEAVDDELDQFAIANSYKGSSSSRKQRLR
jgi:hypothetical protein